MKHPTLDEIALGVFLHDIGKFVQRASGGLGDLPATTRKLESVILPTFEGRPTHWHALWSEAFFQWMEDNGLSFPGGVNRTQVRHVAVFHHRPDSAKPFIGGAGWVAAEADRLASGMDRKPQDEKQEGEEPSRGWQAAVRTALKNPFACVSLGEDLPPAPDTDIPLEELSPEREVSPTAGLDTRDYAERHRRLFGAFQEEFRALCSMNDLGPFCEGLLSLSERFTFAVPSSTVDQPDISLHDHSRAAAAIGSALHQWHEANGSLDDDKAIRNRQEPKYRFLAGDLSGIQRALFRLANQQVKGASRILRARSFLISMTAEAAILECRRKLGLPVFSVVQNAGGNFLLMAGDLPDIEGRVEQVRGMIDPWLYRRYRGELALNLALSPPFSGEALLRKNFAGLQEQTRRVKEEAKLRPFRALLLEHAVHREDRYGPDGVCGACGVRPASKPDAHDPGVVRCGVCHDEHRLGGDLPRVAAISWTSHPAASGRSVVFWNSLRLNWHEQAPGPETGLVSAARLWRAGETVSGPAALRFIANYVPRLSEEDLSREVYRSFVPEEEPFHAGDAKTFEHLAADALEASGGKWRGERFLAVLKADVDSLGRIFGTGIDEADRSLGRYAGISRMMDFFFSGMLPELLRKRFASTYTVYAGGDDLLLIGPWRQTMELARELRAEFARWTGGSPHVTISAALEMVKPSEPLVRSVHRAEERLDRAKRGEKNQVCAIDETEQEWSAFERRLADAEQLYAWLEQGVLSQAFLYRMMILDKSRCAVESAAGGGSGRRAVALDDAAWRAHWSYQLKRNILDKKSVSRPAELAAFLNGLMGLDASLQAAAEAPPARMALTLALYRHRTPERR